MEILSNIKQAYKIAKKIKEIKKYLNETLLSKEVKDDLLILKSAAKRLAAKIPAFEYIFNIIF